MGSLVEELYDRTVPGAVWSSRLLQYQRHRRLLLPLEVMILFRIACRRWLLLLVSGAWLFDRFPCLIPSNPAAEVDCCVCVCASADRWLVGLGGWQNSVRRLGWLIDERVVAREKEEDDFSDCGLLFRGPG